MNCPRCGIAAGIKRVKDLEVPSCDRCGGMFLDHGELGHGQSLHNELIRVPLLVRLPDSERRSGRVSGNAVMTTPGTGLPDGSSTMPEIVPSASSSNGATSPDSKRSSAFLAPAASRLMLELVARAAPSFAPASASRESRSQDDASRRS